MQQQLRCDYRTHQRCTKEQSMRMRTTACTKAYTTSKLYNTPVLYKSVSNPSNPANKHNVSAVIFHKIQDVKGIMKQ